jgi:hypothetical protein
MSSTPEGYEIGLGDVPFGGDGLLYRVATAVGILPGRWGLVRLGVAIAVLTWVPLVILTAFERTLLGGRTIAFSQSYGTHTRLLLAIPLLFFAESLFSGRVSEVLSRMLQGQLVAARDLPRFERAWRQARKWWDSWSVEALLVVVTLASIYSGLRTDLPTGVATWRTTGDGRLSVAGWWYSLVSLPFFQFLIWRWTWRLFVWGRLLWKISRLELRLLPTHPDRAGGLGSLGVAHVDLSPLSFAYSAILAASFAEQIKFGSAALAQFVVPASAVVVGVTAALIVPLLLFSRRLLDVKQRGLLEYGAFATVYARAFDAKWLRGGAERDEPILGTADLQSLADLGNSFGVIGDMRFVPISWAQIIMLAASTGLPFLPLVLFAFPLEQLIIGGVKSLLGV